MKTTIVNLISSSLVAVIILGSSCKKNDVIPNKTIVTLSKSIVKIGEPVIATTNSNDVVKWSVKGSPNNTWVSSSSNKSAIIFSIPGTYAITANYFLDSTTTLSYDSSAATVIVTDSIYNGSAEAGHAHCFAIGAIPLNSDDQITLTPVSYTNNGLILFAHTQDTYGAFYTMIDYTQVSDSATGYGLSFSNILSYPCLPCPSGTQLPGTVIITFGGNNHPLQNGTSDVTFNLNGKIYKGTLTVTSDSCTFNWNYTSGITISPLIIQKG